LSVPPEAPCRRLTDFDDATNDEASWVIVNDGVMGGRSSGFVEFADSAMRFSGQVVTDGGGFTSVRLRTDGDELVGTDRVVLRLRSDERNYRLTFNDAPGTRQRVAHGAEITLDGAADADGWTTVEVAYEDLRPTVFGQPVDAPAFDPEQVSEIGIIIADSVDGTFLLEVDWIDAC
jgi:NADH dehydrogenase [ubiquinone] 1 alpha subcomplex assembly factor 1